MGYTHEACVAMLKEIPGYVLQFEKIFPDHGLTIDAVGMALASFERSLVTGPSPYDYNEAYKRFTTLEAEDLAELKEDSPETYEEYEQLQLAVQINPMSASAVRGFDLFFSKRVGCSACHVGANLADEQYHNLGIGMSAKEPDMGRYQHTKVEKDKGAFKTPTIRNVALSAPYMHDGSLKTLRAVVDFYVGGGSSNPYLDPQLRPLALTGKDREDLVAFLEALTGDMPQFQ